ncbi:mechanosensitive ion channel [Burkholderiaceae bacterium FT117]|uniref:mechanosensitive ion channel family protein n=1 Tax=Zeimonas sediminis TaxID=2944268 RepID=UPI002342C0C1|nr:mechanosensitive ion channel domain-containing protein [Zeimonas sediminis]MCM5570090.1 mechanosensitive ion channel [Zeimonas sediminis]
MLERIDELGQRRAALSSETRRLEGDQQEAARLQLRDVETDLRQLLGKLPELLGQAQGGGPEAAALAARAGDLLRAESRILRSGIDELRSEIASLRQERAKGDEAYLAARAERIAKRQERMDALLADLHLNTVLAGRIGLDASGDGAYLDRQIAARASSVAGEIKLALEQIEGLREQLGGATATDKEALSRRVAAVQREKDRAVESLGKLVALMKARGLDEAEYGELLIRATGQISAEILDAEVARSFFSHQLQQAEKWLRERGPAIGFRILVVLALLVGFKLLAGLARRAVRRLLRSPRLGASALMQRFAVRAAGTVVMLIGILVVLSQFDIEVGHMLAGLGIAGFIVGFALQDILGNFAAGVMILAYRPYDIGDWIEVPDAFGRVQHMNLVSTTILTGDNQRLLVPNKKIWGNIIRNVTAERTRRIDLTFGIGYSDDVIRAERVLREILEADQRVLASPEPLIRLAELGESSVNFIVRPWCRTEDYWELRWHITRRVKERFDEEGISIPFPQRDVHLHGAIAPAIPAGR